MKKGTVSIFGDSIYKGLQFNSKDGRYVVKNNLGFDEIADREGFAVRNHSKIGCTITKAWNYMQRMFPALDGDMVFMAFGSNDCNYDWRAISRSPLNIHKPKTEYYEFIDTYERMVDYVRSRRRVPVLSTLVPIQSGAYLDHLCRTKGLDRGNIDRWLGGDESRVEHYQCVYSDAIKGLASREDIPCIDLRAAFEATGNPGALFCSDGIHPNTRGQAIIHDCFEAFLDDFIVL